ncbi:MAG TPA: MgtC/SapB family protein [Burkholderiales bacterium]
MDWNWLDGTELRHLPAFVTSLAIGLLIGLERERHAGVKAGLRTFALVALFGALGAFLSEQTGSPAVLVAGILIVAAMIITAYATDPTQQEPWTTTVVAVLVCYALAAMVWFDHATTAVMLAIIITALLYFKAELRGITTRLERRDLISILQFGVLMFVILPILPDQNYGPYAVINPRQVWIIVVLISGISLAGYVAFRLIGQRYGAPLLGIFGGLVSSTATTLVYARHGREHPELAPTATVVILLASLVLLVRLAVLTAFMAPQLLRTLLPLFGFGLLPGVVSLAYLGWRNRAAGNNGPVPDIKNPTELRTALAFGAMYAGVLLLAAWLSDIAGSAGLYAVALISGLTDVDAITLSSLRLFNLGALAGGQVAIAVVLAIIANTVFKLGLVLVVGGQPLFRRCAGTMTAVVAGLVVALVVTKPAAL